MHTYLKRPIWPLTLATILAACAHAENYRWSEDSKPNFSNNLTAPDNPKFGSWATPAVTVYSFPTAPSATGDAGLRDLSDRGQAAFIEAMTKKGAKPDDIRDMLAKPIKAKAAQPEAPATVEGSYKRTLVANVTKGWSAKPGDRLVWTWIYMEPINFVFDGYTVVATDTQVLNIEQVTNATTASLSAQLGRTNSDTTGSTTTGSPTSNTLSRVLGGSAGLNGSLTNTYTTTATINQQYVKLGADIMPDGLRIYRESERNLDVAGNTIIALTVRVDPNKLRDAGFASTMRVTALEVLDEQRAFRKAGAVKFEASLNETPPRCDLQANVTLFYQIRRVRDGRSYLEGEQDVDYITDQSAALPVTIVPAGELTKPTWNVFPQDQRASPIRVKDAFGRKWPLAFTSYEQASALAAWMNANPKLIVGRTDVAIGKAGLRIWSGDRRGRGDMPLYNGPYIARPTLDDAAARERQCATIMATAPVAQPAPPPPPARLPPWPRKK